MFLETILLVVHFSYTVLIHRKKREKNTEILCKTCYRKLIFVIWSNSAWIRSHRRHADTWACEQVRHASMWVRKDAKHVGTGARKFGRHVGTWARKHARYVGTWACKTRNSTESQIYMQIIFNHHSKADLGPSKYLRRTSLWNYLTALWRSLCLACSFIKTWTRLHSR